MFLKRYLGGILLVVLLTAPWLTAGPLPLGAQDASAARQAAFGPRLFLLEGAQAEAAALRAAPFTFHGVIYRPSGDLYVVSGNDFSATQAQAAGLQVRLLDGDTRSKAYYLADASAPNASALAGEFGAVLYADERQLLVAVPSARELAFLETLPLRGVHLAALSAGPIMPAAPSQPEPAAIRAEPGDPLITSLFGQVTEMALGDLISGLSGEQMLNIGGRALWLPTRYTLSGGIADAEAYLFDYYTQLGIPVSYAPWTYANYSGRNVVAELRGVVHPERVWLVGGHFDDLSETPYTRAPGADDNGSGTAATLLVARILRGYRFADTIRFVHFSGEEQGMFGSRVYAGALAQAGVQVMGYINLDMLGWDSNSDSILELHTGTRPASIALAGAFSSANNRYAQDLQIELLTDDANRFSDHSSFWDYGYGAFLALENFFDGATPRDRNPWYHLTGDLVARVNLPYVVRSTRVTLATLAELAGIVDPDALTATPTATPTVTSTATATATPPLSCSDLLSNGDMEADRAWQFPHTAYPAGFSSTAAHTGARSLRTGIDTGADVYSYSDAYQGISVPDAGAAVSLRVWWLPRSAEGPLSAAERRAPDARALQDIAAGAAAPTGNSPAAGDYQYILLLEGSSIVKTLLWARADAQAWQELTFDLSAYRGRALQVRFGVLNDGDGRTTAMYLDDVSAWACPVAPTATPTATPTPTATLPASEATPTPTQTASATPSPSATASPTETPTATATPSPTASATPAPSATASPTWTPTTTCREQVTNGGFETTDAWAFPATANRGSYTTALAHSGLRSAQLGITVDALAAAWQNAAPADLHAPQRNLLGERPATGASYSSAYQAISVPSTSRSAGLTFWIWPRSQAASGGDWQRVLLLDGRSYTVVATVLVGLSHAADWQQFSFDMLPYRGRDLVLYFETYNDNLLTGPAAALYVDDVSLLTCDPPSPIVTPTPTTGTPWPARIWLPLFYNRRPNWLP